MSQPYLTLGRIGDVCSVILAWAALLSFPKSPLRSLTRWARLLSSPQFARVALSLHRNSHAVWYKVAHDVTPPT